MQHQKRYHAHLLTLGLVRVHDASALALAHANVLFHLAPDPSLYARSTMLKPLLLNGDFAKPLELYRLSLDNCTHFYVPKVRAKLREGRIGLRVRAHEAKLGFLAKRVVQGRCLMICLDEMNRLGLL